MTVCLPILDPAPNLPAVGIINHTFLSATPTHIQQAPIHCLVYCTDTISRVQVNTLVTQIKAKKGMYFNGKGKVDINEEGT